MNILWVEDSFDTVREIASALHRMGHKILIVSSRKAAVEVLQDGWRGDMVILDSMMPEADRHYTHSGCDLFHDLRSGKWGPWGSNVKVTFITAFEDNVKEKIEGLTPVPVMLAKPLDSSEAIAAMDRAFPDIHVTAGSESTTIINIQGDTIHNEQHLNQLPFTAAQLAEIIYFVTKLLAEKDDEKMKAAQLLLGVATSKDDKMAQQSAIQVFRQWLSSAGDQVKEGLKTSASIVSIATPILKVLGVI